MTQVEDIKKVKTKKQELFDKLALKIDTQAKTLDTMHIDMRNQTTRQTTTIKAQGASLQVQSQFVVRN